jgi:hypothetical protein
MFAEGADVGGIACDGPESAEPIAVDGIVGDEPVSAGPVVGGGMIGSTGSAIFTTNASSLLPPYCGWNASGVVGKSFVATQSEHPGPVAPTT